MFIPIRRYPHHGRAPFPGHDDDHMTDRHESLLFSPEHGCGPAGGGDERRGLVEALVEVLGERDLGVEEARGLRDGRGRGRGQSWIDGVCTALECHLLLEFLVETFGTPEV